MSANSLPSQPTSFVGREQELADIARLLADPACRLLTLLGPGGMGKTRLALEAAQHIDMPDGVFFVPFQSLTSPDFMPSAIAEAIGFQFTPGGEPKQQLFAFLREKSLLLIMDNLEHLLDGVSLLAEIIAHAPGVHLLATSRERLNLREEWVLDVGGLPFPVSPDEADIERYSAVALFLQHTHRVKVSLHLNGIHKAAIVRLCRAVGGMPLALELASNWVRVLSLDEIASEIERCLDILATPARNIEPRHRNMRAAFEPTWKRLTEDERSVFTKLSVFRGGFTREAAEQVTGASLHILSSLGDKSLVRVDANGRYDLHELLRQYAEEQLNALPQMSEDVRNLHGAYYVEFLYGKWIPLRTSHQRKALDDIEVEIDNVRKAWWHLVSQCDVAGIGKALSSFWYFHDVLDRNQEGFELLGQAIEALRANPATQDSNIVLSQLLARQGWFYSSAVGLHAKGQLACEESLTILRRLGKREDMVTPLDSLCMTSVFAKDYVKLRQTAHEGLQIAEESHEAWWIGRFLYWLNLAAKVQHEYAEARQWGEKCLEIAEDVGDLWLLGLVYAVGLGEVAHAAGDFVEAKRRYQQGLSVVEQLRTPWGIGRINFKLGGLAVSSQQYTEAANYYRRSLKLYQEIGQTWEIIDTLAEITTLEVAQGRIERAVELWTLIGLHPATPKHILKRTEGSLTELASNLTPDIYAAARERGKELKLGTVVAEFLNHVEVTDLHHHIDQPLTEPLTARELEVLSLLAAGYSNPAIAQKLIISVGTVKAHTGSIYSKLGVHNRVQAVAQANKLGLL